MEKIDAKTLFASAVIELLKKQNLEEITVKQIVDQSGLSRQSFYVYYHDKFDLINQIYLSDSENATRSTSTFYTNLWSFMEIMKQKKNFYLNALKYNGQNSLCASMAEHSFKVHSELIIPKIKDNATVAKVTQSIHIHSYGLAFAQMNWALTGMKIPPKELSRIMVDSMPDIMKQYYIDVDRTLVSVRY